MNDGVGDVLPDGWTRTRLDSIAEINPSRPKYTRLSNDQAIGFVPMAAVDAISGAVTEIEHRPLSQVRDKSFRTFERGDVLFAKITPCMENGKSAVVPELPSGVGFGSTEFHVLRPSPVALDAAYLWRFLRQQPYRDEAERHMTGSVGQLRVPVDFLRATVLPLPPIAEQRRIATRLDAIDARRSAAAGRLRDARATVQRSRTAVLAAACSGRLTADWRRAHPGLASVESALAQKAATRKARRASQIIDLPRPELPDSYVVSTIGAAAEVIEYGTSKRCDARPEDGVPVLRMGNIQTGRLDTTDLKYCRADDEIARLLLHEGDLLFNRTNSPALVGKSAVYHDAASMSFASYLIRVRFCATIANPDFVNLWINSSYGRIWAQLAKTDGVSQSNINGSKLAWMPISLPPVAEQVEIVRRADRALAIVDDLVSRIDSATAILERISRSSLAMAFRGDLVPTEVSLAAMNEPAPNLAMDG